MQRFSEQDLRQILDVLKAIEQLGGRLACTNAHDDAIARLVDIHERMMELYRKRQRLEYFKLNQSIHSGIVQASGNPVLAEMHEMLQARIKRMRYIGNEGAPKWAGAVAEHEEMIEASARRRRVPRGCGAGWRRRSSSFSDKGQAGGGAKPGSPAK